MSVFDIFRSAPVAPAAAPTAPTEPAAPVTPDPSTAPVTPAADTTPLADFTKLWETDSTDTSNTDSSVFGNVDPKAVFEAAKNANFAGTISADVLQAIAAGGEGAVAALQAAMNSATQAAFAQSTIATTKLIEQAISKTNAANLAALPGLVKRHSAADSLTTENPALSSAAASPIISAVQAQLALKFPNATSSELTGMAKKYLVEFANTVNPAPAIEPPKPAPGETDWSKFELG